MVSTRLRSLGGVMAEHQKREPLPKIGTQTAVASGKQSGGTRTGWFNPDVPKGERR